MKDFVAKDLKTLKQQHKSLALRTYCLDFATIKHSF